MSDNRPEIVQQGNPVLRGKAEPVNVAEITSDPVRKIIKDMSTALASQNDGIAIAAPQIGVGLQIFIISGSKLAIVDKSYKGPKEDLVFINPKITRRSKEKQEMEEGCLSVRWLYGKVKRSVRVTLSAYDQNGKSIERGASGLLAQIFQHETDHLNGILFIDEADEVWEMTEEEIREATKNNQ